MNVSRRLLILLILFLLFIGLKLKQKTTQIDFFQQTDEKQLLTRRFPAKVNKIMDGDTIEVSFVEEKPEIFNNTESIRFIGINCPELNLHKENKPEYFSKEAYLFTKKELMNQYVEIQLDDVSKTRDKYGRVLAYVWIDNHLFNQILVERGYAKYYSHFDFNADNMLLFQKAEEYSKLNCLGMWENHE